MIVFLRELEDGSAPRVGAERSSHAY